MGCRFSGFTSLMLFSVIDLRELLDHIHEKDALMTYQGRTRGNISLSFQGRPKGDIYRDSREGRTYMGERNLWALRGTMGQNAGGSFRFLACVWMCGVGSKDGERWGRTE